MKYLCIALVKFYWKFLSPLKRRSCCRFVPSCSQYAIEAFQKRGFFVGMILTVWRILRCNPYCVGGYDPVPETGLRNRRSVGKPITKYFYPEEYHLERREEEGDVLPNEVQQ